MEQIGIHQHTEQFPSDWDLIEQYFYEDAGLKHINTDAGIQHLLKVLEDTNDTTKEYKTD